MTRMEPNDTFDDFDTQIQSDELIPEWYEEQLEEGDWEPCEGDPEELPHGWDVEQEEFPW